MQTKEIKNQEIAKIPNSQNVKGIENHKKTAMHLEEAAKSHNEAANHHEAGNHDKAFQATIKAQGHMALASDAQREDLKQHAVTG